MLSFTLIGLIACRLCSALDLTGFLGAAAFALEVGEGFGAAFDCAGFFLRHLKSSDSFIVNYVPVNPGRGQIRLDLFV